MASASASLELSIPAHDVWQLIGGFLSLPDWVPFITESTASDGGRVRHLRTADGGAVVERLEHYDNAARTYSYSITEGPFPVTDYLATLKVEALTAGTTRITWGGQFVPAGVTVAESETLFQGVYEGGLAALQAHYSAKG